MDGSFGGRSKRPEKLPAVNQLVQKLVGYMMKCVSPLHIKHKLGIRIYRDKFGNPTAYLEVPCGKCIACRVNYSSIWSARLMHELSYWDKSMFLTLTYDDEHIPLKGSLFKRDLQLFFKRLRKASGRKFKYYACGEYGDAGQRPHYHMVLFGFDYSSIQDRRMIKAVWQRANIHTGYNFGTVTRDSCRYTCDYIMKAYISGNDKAKFFEETGREPPFRVSSLGIGKRYCLDNAELLKKRLYCLNPDGHKVPLPRYYRTLLGISAFDYYDIIRKNEELYKELYNESPEKFAESEFYPAQDAAEFMHNRSLKSFPRDLNKDKLNK